MTHRGNAGRGCSVVSEAMPVAAGNRGRRRGLATLAACVLGCSGPTRDGPRDGPPDTAPRAPAVEPNATAAAGSAHRCPAESITRTVAPDVTARLRHVETWLSKLPNGAADTVLLDPVALPALNARFAAVKGAFRDPLAPEVGDRAQVAASIAERSAWMRARVDEGHYHETEPGALGLAEGLIARAVVVDELRIMVDEAPLWCVPLTTGLFKPPVDPAFDRNRCASLHPGEVVRVLRRTQTEPPWLYVDSGHTTGWLRAPTTTPDLPREHLAPLWREPYLLPLRDDVTTSSGHPFRLGTRLPLQGEQTDAYRVLVPTAEGPKAATVPTSAAVVVGPQPLTRRALWGMALAELDKPYGWGGTGGARDCSRFLRDLLVGFGVQLARNSGVQAKLGTDRIDVGTLPEAAKRQALADAAARGVVLLYMPGHIMLYLGRDGGRDYAVSAISEWLEPCEGGEDTVLRLDRVAVTTLALGRDTERTSYIERITTLVVFGAPSSVTAVTDGTSVAPPGASDSG